MNSRIIRNTLPHLVAVITFIILSYAYFYPVLEGKKVNAHDSKVFVGSSKEITDYREATGKESLWTNSMFGGMPAYLISTQYPGNLIKKIDIALKAFKIPVAALFLAFLGFYILLLCYGVKPWLALTGALAYGFTSFLFASLSAGHNTKVFAMAYMAPVIGSVIYSFRNDALKGSALFAFFLSLQIMANHFQITYYTFIILLIFGIWELAGAIKEKKLAPFFKSILLLFAGAIIAVGVNFASIYSTWEYSKESTRGKSDLVKTGVKEEKGLDKEYITQWSYGIGETMTLLIPNARGGASKMFEKDSETLKALRKNDMSQYSSQLSRYWGEQPSTSGPVYFGIVVIFLFIIGLIIIPTRDRWWILTAVLLSILLAWGHNLMFFTSLFVDFFPGYNKFRAVTMILVIAGVCVPLLAVLALKEILEGNVNKAKALQAVKISALITGGLALIFFLIPGLAGSFLSQREATIPDSLKWLKDAMIIDRKMMLRTDALRSVIMVISGAAVIWFFLKGKLKTTHVIILMSLVFLIDQIPVDTRYMNGSNFESKRDAQNALNPTTADKAILQDKDEFRVLNLTVSTFNDASTSYYHKSVGGYHGAKMKRYQELIESELVNEIESLVSVLQSATTLTETDQALSHANALNMLNTRYIILSPDSPPLKNNNSLGNAWFVSKASVVENANAELDALKTINPSSEAVVDRRFADMLTVQDSPASSGDTIYLTAYEPNKLTYKSKLATDRIAVFSEIYYPYGWKAFVEDAPSAHFRTDYVLRGMVVPAGEHTITFRFEPQSYKTGNRVSLASSLILLILLAGAGLKGFVTLRKNGNDK